MTKPIAFYDPHKGFYWAKPTKITAPVTVDVKPLSLYTQRTWIGLTDKQMEKICFDLFQDCYFPKNFKLFAKAIEAKLKEKNT